jgi:hypothetical protein
MTVCTVLCWGSWLLVLFFINPETTGILGFTLFYFSLFFALTGSLALISYFFRAVFTKRYSKTEEVQISFRQAIFWALVLALAMFLQAQNLLNWLNTLLLVMAVTIIEFLILSLKKEKFEASGQE